MDSPSPKVPPVAVHLGIPHKDIQDCSLAILDYLEEENVEVDLAASALALTLGRVISPARLSPTEESAFLQAIVEWSGLYFCEGSVH